MPEALPPGSTVGILGGGQLGRMLALAAAGLGLKTHIYSDEPNVPAFDVSAFSTIGSFEDEAALGAFAASVDVVTCEFENVPARALEIAGAQSARASPGQVLRSRPRPARGEGLHARSRHPRGRLTPTRMTSRRAGDALGAGAAPSDPQDEALRL